MKIWKQKLLVALTPLVFVGCVGRDDRTAQNDATNVNESVPPASAHMDNRGEGGSGADGVPPTTTSPGTSSTRSSELERTTDPQMTGNLTEDQKRRLPTEAPTGNDPTRPAE